MDGIQKSLPLTEAFYYILVAIYQKPLHGYGIMQDVEKMSQGRVRIGAGTLYTALNTLLKKRLVENVPTPAGGDSRRKLYAMTGFGREVIAAEISRLEEMVTNGRRVIERGAFGDEQS